MTCICGTTTEPQIKGINHAEDCPMRARLHGPGLHEEMAQWKDRALTAEAKVEELLATLIAVAEYEEDFNTGPWVEAWKVLQRHGHPHP